MTRSSHGKHRSRSRSQHQNRDRTPRYRTRATIDSTSTAPSSRRLHGHRHARLSAIAANSMSDTSTPRTRAKAKLVPPQPPIALTPALACDPHTDQKILWHIARHAPQLRMWVCANPAADAQLLEFIAQAGGPHVHDAIELLLQCFDGTFDESQADAYNY